MPYKIGTPVIIVPYTVGTTSLLILHMDGWGTEWPRDLSRVTWLGSGRAEFNCSLVLELELLLNHETVYSQEMVF